MRAYAILLIAVGLLQIAGDLTGVQALKGIGAATVASPAPKVFSSVKGLETFSTRFFIEWKDAQGETHSLELMSKVAANLRGPYNRRNIYGAVLAYGPVLTTSESGAAMLNAVLDYALTGDAPLLTELGVDTSGVRDVAIVYEPLPGTSMGDLPTRIEVRTKP